MSCFSWICSITLAARALVTLDCHSTDAVRIFFAIRGSVKTASTYEQNTATKQ
jgi:hypothetical protein